MPGGLQSISRLELEAHFHMSVTDATVALSVGTTLLKTLCRKLGVSRWPYRRVRRVLAALTKMQVGLPQVAVWRFYIAHPSGMGV